MPKETEDVQAMEKESIVFHGAGGKVTWTEFEKSIARYFRLKYGSEIGEMLWRNEMPVIEGDDALDRNEFKEHCQIVLEAISISSPQRYATLKPQNSGFWEVDWHLKWRKREWRRMIDIVSMKCKGQALLVVEDLSIDDAARLRKHLVKHFGGASEDVKERELLFDEGLPDKPGGKAFPKGVDIEVKLRQIKSEWIELTRMCPVEDRSTYEYAKERTMVKVIMKHIQQTEYARPLKELLQEMKVERMVKRKIEGGGEQGDVDEIDIDDWEHRNYKDSWLPSFERLRTKLISHYKERKYLGNQRQDDDKKRSLPSMVNKIIDNTVKVMLAPAFGLKPQDRGRSFQRNQGTKRHRSSSSGKNDKKTGDGNRRDNEKKPKCWACGEIGHRSTDPECKAPPGTLHKDAPKRAKTSHARNDMKDYKSKREICKFYRDTGKCKFGAKCN